MQALPEDAAHSGFLVARLVQFLGRILRHGGMSPTWHLRLFRTGAGRCEEREYDQHFYLLQGSTGKLDGVMVDEIRMPLSEWTARHNRWSDAEVREQLAAHGWRARRASLVGKQCRAEAVCCAVCTTARPCLCAPACCFFTGTCCVWAFLDGREGLIFWTLQTFWFRFLIDAKLFEQQRQKSH